MLKAHNDAEILSQRSWHAKPADAGGFREAVPHDRPTDYDDSTRLRLAIH